MSISISFLQKLFCVFLTIIIILIINPSSAHASDNFHTILNSSYSVTKSGDTQVTKEFFIKNKKSTIYLKKYGIELTSNRISNIKIFDDQGEISANITQTDLKTTLGFEFPESEKIVGKDQTQHFTLTYTDPDVALFEGSILEVHVPRLLDPEEFDEYQVKISIPGDFQNPTLSTPKEYLLENHPLETIITYNSIEAKSGVSALFGDKQHYYLDLKYDLSNPSQSQGTVQIALPPDTQYQKISYQSLDPLPQDIKVDADGNWIATYQIDSNSQQTVAASAIATIFLQPQLDIPIQFPSKQLTQPDKYWESDSEKIIKLSEMHSTPKEIFDYVSQNLQYNYDRLESTSARQHIDEVLNHPENSVCQEFSDLFITLARANGIPARQIIGYALTNNPQIRPLSLVQDVLHAWPEFFDKESSTWIPVDPTWTNTTGGIDYFSQLDFNHIAFVVQGQSSQKPHPPGAGKVQNSEGKNVTVTVTDQEPETKFQVETQVIAPIPSPLGLNNQHTVVIKNTSGKAWYNVPIHFSAQDGISLSQNVYVIEHFLPFQTITLPLYVTDQNSTQAHDEVIIITIENIISQHVARAGSHWSRWYQAIQNPLTIIIILTTLIAITVLTAIIIIQGRKRKK